MEKCIIWEPKLPYITKQAIIELLWGKGGVAAAACHDLAEDAESLHLTHTQHRGHASSHGTCQQCLPRSGIWQVHQDTRSVYRDLAFGRSTRILGLYTGSMKHV